jgi:hypothetical protein
MGACPGNEESAGVNYSHRCPKGNRQMRRVLKQAANAAVKAKGTIFAVVYRRLVPRLGHAQAIGAIAHRLCCLIWKILHQGIRYEEPGPDVTQEARQAWARKLSANSGVSATGSSSPHTLRRRDGFRTWLIRGVMAPDSQHVAVDDAYNPPYRASINYPLRPKQLTSREHVQHRPSSDPRVDPDGRRRVSSGGQST